MFKSLPTSIFMVSPSSLLPMMLVSCPDFVASVSWAVIVLATCVSAFSFTSPFALL